MKFAAIKRRHLALLVIGCAALLATSRSAHAQQGINTGAGGYFVGHTDNPVGPTVSPYLNLLNNNNFGNGSGGFTNYQSLVKPLEDYRQDAQAQSAAIQGLQHAVTQGRSGPIRGTGLTGQQLRYMNYSHYYTFGRK